MLSVCYFTAVFNITSEHCNDAFYMPMFGVGLVTLALLLQADIVCGVPSIIRMLFVLHSGGAIGASLDSREATTLIGSANNCAN